MTTAKTLALRFGVVFGALSVFPFPLDLVPKLGDRIDQVVTDAWTPIEARVGDWFGLEVTRHPSGSGDTLADYVHLCVVVAVAAVVAAAWSVAMRGRGDCRHPRLAAWARVGLRYYLAGVMLSYGLAKVLPHQFGVVTDLNLYDTVGSRSPMGMLWTFMAVSQPYQVFTGLVECMGGALLLWRRTTLAGALMVATAMTNVVALNYCYDVPVKLFSSQLLIGALVLIAPDARRLVAAVLARDGALTPWVGRSRTAAKVGVIVVLAYALYQQASVSDGGHTPLYNIWDVERFERDGAVVPLGDPARWLFVSIRSQAVVRTMDGVDHVHAVTKEDDGRLELGNAGSEGSFAAEVIGDRAVLTGRYDGRAVRVELRRPDLSKMPLVSRGFHWVQEYPFNR